MDKFEKMKSYSPVVVRIAISLVFLWFGTNQLMHGQNWVSLIPASINSMTGLSALALVHFNGAFELVFGITLILGFFTRIVALLLGLHLLSIVTVVGYTAIGVRDFGLSFATLSIFLHGKDFFTLDSWLEKKKE